MPFTWNSATRQYYDGTRAIPRSEVRGWIRGLRAASQSQLETISQQYVASEINHAEWAIQYLKEIKDSRTAIRALVSGGKDQVTAREWAQLGGLNKQEFSYFQQFERDVANDLLTDAQILDRARLYSGGIERLYEDLVRQRDVAAGATLAINILGGSKESCSECPALSAAGAIPITDMPEVGFRECGPGCNCEVQYLTAAEAATV